jgi:hypothetical protein
VKKTDVLDVVHAMPEEVDIDELLHRLRLRQCVEVSERAFVEGCVLTHDEVVRRSRSWFR